MLPGCHALTPHIFIACTPPIQTIDKWNQMPVGDIGCCLLARVRINQDRGRRRSRFVSHEYERAPIQTPSWAGYVWTREPIRAQSLLLDSSSSRIICPPMHFLPALSNRLMNLMNAVRGFKLQWKNQIEITSSSSETKSDVRNVIIVQKYSHS